MHVSEDGRGRTQGQRRAGGGVESARREAAGMLRWSQGAVRAVRGVSEASPGRFWSGPGESKKTWCRRTLTAVRALRSAPHYIGQGFSYLRGAPRGVFPAGPKDFQKSVV